MKVESFHYPFRHWIIDDFEMPGYVFWEDVAREFPPRNWRNWIRYDSPVESKKRTCEDLETMPVYLAMLIRQMQSLTSLQWLSDLTGIKDLMIDSTLRGGGIHATDRGGRLDIHVDYAIHPTLHLERRLNAILFMNREWSADWGGDLELWDASARRCEKAITPAFRKLVLFECSDESYHGCPVPLNCPEEVSRHSVAVYYLCPPRGRRRALFVPRREA